MTYTNEYGTAWDIFNGAMRAVRENKEFHFNLTDRKMENLWKEFDREVKIIERNESIGNDMSKERKMLEKIYWEMIA